MITLLVIGGHMPQFTVTEYVPGEVTLMLGVVAPVFHRYVQDGAWQFCGLQTTTAFK